MCSYYIREKILEYNALCKNHLQNIPLYAKISLERILKSYQERTIKKQNLKSFSCGQGAKKATGVLKQQLLSIGKIY